MDERKYFVNESMRFNLDSMIDTVHCIGYAFEGDEDCAKKYLNGRDYVVIDGTKLCDENDCYAFLEELYDLQSKAYGRVTGAEYGRIKRIAEERQMMRYNTCIASGMNDYDAGYAFM